MHYVFSRAQGLEEAKSSLAQALSSGKFPHALLVHGPEGVGQNALLLDLADILLCDSEETRPCGACPGCLGRIRNNLDGLIFLMPIEKKDKASGEGEVEDAQIDELTFKAREFHDDPYGFSRSEKSNLNIAQIRAMQSRLSFAEASLRPRVVVILWAEAMAHPAANTLLKTLEEPPANTYFLLSSDDRASLLRTILSRCSQLALFPMPPEALRAAMSAQAKAWRLENAPERLIPFAEGSPGVLLSLHRDGGEALLEEAGRFLAAAVEGRRDTGSAWLAFSDYIEGSDAFTDMDSTARLAHFLLRTLRLFHRLSALEGPIVPARDGSHAWTREALARQGLDPSLADCLGPLERAGSLDSLAGLIGEILSAVQSYAKPRVAALGLYLEYASKHLRKETQAC